MTAPAASTTAPTARSADWEAAAAAVSRRQRRRKRLIVMLRYAIVLIALAVVLFPIFWIVSMAFKTPDEYFSSPPVWIPSVLTTRNFELVWEEKGSLAFKNSLIIGLSATAISLAIGILCAYSLVRFRTGGRHFPFWILSQRLMPPVVLVIPFFLLLRETGKHVSWFGLDSHGALIALYTLVNLPFVTWMLRSYFAGVPHEIEESALVDGCTQIGVLWRITLPLTIPGLIATGTFAFIFSWTEFLFAVSFTRTQAVTLPVVISGFTGSQGSNWGQAAALAVIATAPLFVLGLLVQKHFVRGLTLGAVRG
jgi:multiple sugar transport system permease protein